MNIVLIGFMGSGKSTTGKRLADKMNYEFIETDDLIVEKAGKSIKDIFADIGEEGFRKLESEVIVDVASKDGVVISCGGGVVLDENNIGALRASSTILCLGVKLESVMKRVGGDDSRPLLKDAEKLYASREGLYEKYADFTFDTDGLTAEEVADNIYGDVEKWI